MYIGISSEAEHELFLSKESFIDRLESIYDEEIDELFIYTKRCTEYINYKNTTAALAKELLIYGDGKIELRLYFLNSSFGKILFKFGNKQWFFNVNGGEAELEQY